MRRFLVLYTTVSTHKRHYAEGIIHYDNSVYLRDFFDEEGKLFFDLQGMISNLRANEDIAFWNILMIDKETRE